MTGLALALLAALLGASPVAGQEQGRVAVTARVAPLTIAVTPEILKAVVTPLQDHRSDRAIDPGPQSVTVPSRLTRVRATHQCAGTGGRGCRLLVEVQLLAN
jgi:hypothetical protein